MDSFLTWDVLLTFSGLVGAVYMVVEFTKEIKFIKKIPTKYWSWIVALILLVITNIVLGKFAFKDMVLYLLNAIVISLSSNGLNDFNKNKKNKEIQEEKQKDEEIGGLG
jgi:hypothetical protein